MEAYRLVLNLSKILPYLVAKSDLQGTKHNSSNYPYCIKVITTNLGEKIYINYLGSFYSTLTLKTKPVNVIGVSDVRHECTLFCLLNLKRKPSTKK